MSEERAPRPRLLTVKEAAAVLRVCTATVYALVEQGELRHVRIRNAIRIVVDADPPGA
jgi:excisionase family DNA binding protein